MPCESSSAFVQKIDTDFLQQSRRIKQATMTTSKMIGDMPDDLSKVIQGFARPNTTYFRITIDTDVGGNYPDTAKERRFYDKEKADEYWEELVEDFEDEGYTLINYQEWKYDAPKNVYPHYDMKEEFKKRWCIVPRKEKSIARHTCECCSQVCFRSPNDPYADDRGCINEKHYDCERCGINMCGGCGEWNNVEGMVCYDCLGESSDEE